MESSSERDLRMLCASDLYYHGTSTTLLPSIMQAGLQPHILIDRVDDEDRPLVLTFLSLDPVVAQGYAERKVEKVGGEAIVLGLRIPWTWVKDHLVSEQMVLENGHLAFGVTIPSVFLAGRLSASR